MSALPCLAQSQGRIALGLTVELVATGRLQKVRCNRLRPKTGQMVDLETLKLDVRIALERLGSGRHARSLVLVGSIQSATSQALESLRSEATTSGAITSIFVLGGDTSLPAAMASGMRGALEAVGASGASDPLLMRGRRALAGFCGATKLQTLDVGSDGLKGAEPGLADNGDLQSDLAALIVAVGEALKSSGRVLGLFLDRVEDIPPYELGVLVEAMHRCAQRNLPVMLVAAGGPRIRSHLAKARPYSEMLFEFSPMPNG